MRLGPDNLIRLAHLIAAMAMVGSLAVVVPYSRITFVAANLPAPTEDEEEGLPETKVGSVESRLAHPPQTMDRVARHQSRTIRQAFRAKWPTPAVHFVLVFAAHNPPLHC